MADRTTLLTEDQISEWLPSLPRWERRGAHLHRELSFRDFSEAFGFITMVALVSDQFQPRAKRPDWPAQNCP